MQEIISFLFSLGRSKCLRDQIVEFKLFLLVGLELYQIDFVDVLKRLHFGVAERPDGHFDVKTGRLMLRQNGMQPSK